MEFRDIKDVLTFAAFRPEPDNASASWIKRFPNRRSVLINVSRNRVDWCMLSKKQKVEDTGYAEGDFMDVASGMADEWAARTDDGWLGVSVNTRFIITLEHNLSRKAGWEETIRNNPKGILGTKYDRAKRYALCHNPETSSSLLMACDNSLIQSIEDTLRNHNLRPARIACGLFAITTHALSRIDTDPAMKAQDVILITWSNQSLFVMRQKGGQWQDARCRSGLPPQDANAISQIVKPFLKDATPNTRVLFIADEPGTEFEMQYLPQLGNFSITNLTEQHHLWNLLGRH
ncbi:MAG: hypothetical protein KDM63_00795 [Verrucomicrobiae bacterium]|nr:hypothetical protein [Verrucomicrobiae bacterium]MCB1085555.1 hypothetical protein [Verrucomicrobiae bacterium]MCB1089909.1 hypothetical protein [Verrucomicrobiae bacterium]